MDICLETLLKHFGPKNRLVTSSPTFVGFFVCGYLGLVGFNITFHLTKQTKVRETQYNTPIKRTIKQKYSIVSSYVSLDEGQLME